MTIFYYTIKRAFKSKANIIVIMVMPLILILFPAFQDSFPFGVYMYGLLMFFSAFLLSKQISENRTNKTIIRISAAPISYFKYLLNMLAAFSLIMFVQNIVFVVGLKIYWKDDLTDAFKILLFYFNFSVFSIAFSLFWMSIFKTYYTAFASFSGVANIMLMLSGVAIPLSALPDQLKNFIWILPPYWLANGLDMVYNNDSMQALLSHGILIMSSVIFMMIGSRRRF